MSTLKVNTVQHNTTGFNNVVQFTDGGGTENGTLCRAWVNFNGTGTVAIRDDFNAGSITDNGTGDYTITFDSAFANADYMWTGSIMSTSNLTITRSLQLHRPTSTTITDPTTSNIRVTATDFSNANPTDQEYVTLIVYA